MAHAARSMLRCVKDTFSANTEVDAGGRPDLLVENNHYLRIDSLLLLSRIHFTRDTAEKFRGRLSRE